MQYVLDACSLIAFLQKEAGEEIVYQVLQNAYNHPVFVHKATVFEVYYDALRSGGSSLADAVLERIYRFPIEIETSMDDHFMQAFASFKVTYKVSFADCFVLALATLQNAVIVSADHHEFDAVEKSGEAKFKWIR